MSTISEDVFILTTRKGGAFEIYSIRVDGEQSVFLFEDRDDAERYVIMMEQDPEYIVGETMFLDITEVPLSMALDVFNEKNLNYVYIKSDDLFVPPR